MRALVLVLALGACAHPPAAGTIGAACKTGQAGCVDAYPARDLPPPAQPRWRPPITIPAGLLETELGAKALRVGDLAVCE